jgi:hypothetical protein
MAPTPVTHRHSTGDVLDLPYDDLLQPISGHHGRRSTSDGGRGATASQTLRRQPPPSESREDTRAHHPLYPCRREGQETGSDAAPRREHPTTAANGGGGAGTPAATISTGRTGCASDPLRRRHSRELVGGGAVEFGGGGHRPDGQHGAKRALQNMFRVVKQSDNYWNAKRNIFLIIWLILYSEFRVIKIQQLRFLVVTIYLD